MGISGMPEPADGLVWFLLYNTVASVAAVAGLLRAALVSLDLQHAAPSWLLDGEDEAATAEAAGPGLAERFRRSFRPLRFGPAAAAADCRVCLAGFEPEAVVNRLPCGHLFHRRCVETWLLYDRATCPLCRARVLPAAAAAVEAAPRLVEPE
ncbi:hypothetical protein ACP4OV_025466 [Aristida adscensionis]